jgi:hypothetical protein
VEEHLLSEHAMASSDYGLLVMSNYTGDGSRKLGRDNMVLRLGCRVGFRVWRSRFRFRVYASRQRGHQHMVGFRLASRVNESCCHIVKKRALPPGALCGVSSCFSLASNHALFLLHALFA